MFANQRGCDGDRLYFDGDALICVNDTVLAQGKQFDLAEVVILSKYN